jgi:hypothetical protein
VILGVLHIALYAFGVGFYFLPASEKIPERISHRQYSVGISSTYVENSCTGEQLVNAPLDVSNFCTQLTNRFFGEGKLSPLSFMVQYKSR